MSNIGFRIFKKVRRPDKALMEQFRGLPVANIGDEMNRIACMAARIRPFNKAPLLGPAFTIRARIGDNLMMHAALDMAEPGDVLVIDGQGDTTQAITGENMLMWAERRKLGGVVIDGAVRDVESVAKLDLPVYAAGVQPNGPYKMGPGEINVPVMCGGLVVNPGDILVGDADGIVVIRPKDAEEVLAVSKAKLAQELRTREQIVAGTWNRSAFSEEAMRKLGCQIIDDYHDA